MSDPTPLALSRSTVEEVGRFILGDGGGDLEAWLDIRSGEVFLATEVRDVDDDRLHPLPEWQREVYAALRAIRADETGRWLQIPVSSEFAQPGVLSEFADSLADPALRAEVWDATRGRGAFRRVKDLLHRRGRIELWYAFERERQTRAVRGWLASEGYDLTLA